MKVFYNDNNEFVWLILYCIDLEIEIMNLYDSSLLEEVFLFTLNWIF